MKKRIPLLGPLIMLLVLHSSAGQKPADAPIAINSRADVAKAMDQVQADLVALDKSHLAYQQAAEKVGEIYSNLSQKVQAVTRAADAVKPGRTDPKALDHLQEAIKHMQETQMSFNLQYLQLQNTMQNENRQYTMVSNIMKTKHDTVKNSISNIR